LLTFFSLTSISLPCDEDLGLTMVKHHEVNGLHQSFIADASVSLRDASAPEPVPHGPNSLVRLDPEHALATDYRQAAAQD
jgi:hypothetical protein